MPIERVMLLEDDEILRRELEGQLRQGGYDVSIASTLSEARGQILKESYDLVIADVRLPDGDGSELLQLLQGRQIRPIVIIISGHGSVSMAMECMRAGAFDYLIKPFTFEQLEVSLCRAAEFSQLVKVNRFLSQSTSDDLPSELVGSSPAMQQVRELIRKVAPTDATVLIQGESGTGKELVAREIYRQSLRSAGPYIRVNCAAIPEALIESEFFGHERGAFTGALTRRDGRFMLADGGTILLDEVSEVELCVQAKLLRVIQEKELERVGGTKTLSINVRVVATTNRNLEESISRREFREDLYFRLNVFPIHLPALRDRISDVVELAEGFVAKAARKLGIPAPAIGPDCLETLLAHNWPGNVRELQNVLQRAMIFCAGADTLTAAHLGMNRTRPGASPRILLPDEAAPAGEALTLMETLPTLEHLEKDLIFAALKRCNNNRTHAAKMIGISLRTLRNKLSEYRRAGYREAMITRDLEDAVSEAA